MGIRLLLVRHGQSEWNAVGRWQGQADPPLSDIGRRQAVLAARAVGVVDAVVSSDLQRATETAMLIAEEIGVGPVVIEPGFRERDAGEWSGLTRREIEQGWPGYLDDTPTSGFGPGAPRRPAGWEPDAHLLARALDAIGRVHELVGSDDSDALVITHGGLIYSVERHLGAPMVRLANLEGRWLDVSDNGMKLGQRVLLVDPDDTPVTVPSQL